MSLPSWEQEILKSLAIRDEVEKKDLGYFRAFEQVSQQLQLQAQQQQQLQNEAQDQEQGQRIERPSTSSTISKSPSPSLVDPKLASSQTQKLPEAQQSLTQLALLIKQNHQLANEITELVENLNSATLKNEKLESMVSERDGAVKNLQSINGKLKQKIESLKFEIKEKNRTIEFVNDELLTYQMQNNVLREKLKK
ncbi:uncharacterized protein LODBEIA_P54710 [Lodderomyces beijingensis]|uniref:Autophagy-related protein 16 domain-containing protein n=1 Tax=Lodderomyces beijingensis TaxID=1775926 RepID=A0ABP0ZT01_9ASCO